MFAFLKQTPPTPAGVCPDQVRTDIKAILAALKGEVLFDIDMALRGQAVEEKIHFERLEWYTYIRLFGRWSTKFGHPAGSTWLTRADIQLIESFIDTYAEKSHSPYRKFIKNGRVQRDMPKMAALMLLLKSFKD